MASFESKYKTLANNYTLFIIFLFLSLNPKQVCGSCDSNSKIKDGSSCFNQIIRFDGGYRAGQFTLRKDGVLYIEYSSGGKRLFYSLQPNGRGTFTNDETNKEINIISNSYYNNALCTNRYESKNYLVYLSNDNSQTNPYIFSVSAYITLAELHYFDSDGNNSHKSWLTTDFFGINEQHRYIFSYQFSLFGGSSNIYYAAFIQYQGTTNGKDYSETYTLIKYKFTDSNSREIIKQKEMSNNYDNRIVSAFIMDYYNCLAVFFLKDNPVTYTMRLHNLDTLDCFKHKEFYGINDDVNKGEGIFFKGIYLRYEYVAFIFFTKKDNGKSLKLRIFYINKNNDYSVDSHLSKDLDWYDLDTSIRFNEFYKINNESLLFVSTINPRTLIIMFFDTYNWYEFLNIRSYKFEMEGYDFKEELSIDFYNNFIMFTSTVRPSSGSGSLSSILLFFSYPNGTDFYLNISPYVMDSEYYSNGNLINYLLSTNTIDNNIFGYTLINEIKLISIPNEIIFYRQGSNTPLINGAQIGSNHILNQNKNLIKYDKNYTLDYQFMALGKASYNDLYNQAHDKDKIFKNSGTSYNYENDYKQNVYYGRTNRLTFRLCHDYCETCKELGNSNNNQKCLTCLPKYQYDYYNYFNIFPENCVPEGYFNDLGTNKQIVECTDSNSKFYFNKTDNNKKICFGNQKECPETYAFLNITNNECLNYTPSIPTTLPIIETTLPLIPTTIPKIETTLPINPTTIPIISTTMPIIPTTIPKIPTTIPIIPTTITKIQTTIPKLLTTIPIVSTTQKIITTIPKISTITPIISTIIPEKQTTIPLITTNNLNIPTTQLISTTETVIKITTIVPKIPTTNEKISTTILTIKPTTNLIPIPTTIINPISTTMVNIIPTSDIFKIKNNPTTFITTIPLIKTTIQEEISTSYLNISTTLPKIIGSAIYVDKCLNGTFITNLCSNISDEELFSRLKTEIFDSYASDKKSKIYSGNGDYSFRVSNTLTEMNDLNSLKEFSLIDLGECEHQLKRANNIPLDSELIILKKEKIDDKSSEKEDIQYDIYHPTTYEKLNLSVCENITIDLYVPLKLSEEQEKIYNKFIEQGYNPFDLNDKFYREICTPYNSENGTDVLLDEREEFFYYPIAEQMVCQNNCYYSSYSLDTKYMKCECGKNKTNVKLDLKHLSTDNILQSFLSTFKSTNYKVMICYNLVFNLKIFLRNIGSIITLLFFIAYILFMIYYCQKGIQPLKIEISKILFNSNANDNIEEYNQFNTKNYEKNNINEKGKQPEKRIIKRKGKNPPKKQNNKNTTNTSGSKNKPGKKHEIFSKNSHMHLKNKTNNILRNPIILNKKLENTTQNNMINIYESKSNINNLQNKLDTITKNENKLDNYELNNLEYDEACESDNRGFCKTCVSVLMREHIFLFTFCTCYDYNLFYIKIERLFTLVCIEMTVNGLFFVHETMHRKYVENEDFTFVQKIPQLLFTLIVSHIIEVILCFLGLTDSPIYEIKEMSKSEKNNEKVVDIIDRMKNKLKYFFIFTFILFLFNWYFISAFCAVYQNTQKIFLRDTGISFLTSMIDPFIIYGATTVLRYISLLGCCKKKLGCLYKLSDLIPIF